MITKQDLAKKIIDYLLYDLTISDLVDWSEDVMLNEDIEENDLPLIRDIIAHLGLSDTLAFELSFDDCRKYLKMLGYEVIIDVKKAAVN